MLTVERGSFAGRFRAWAFGADEERVPFAARIRDNDLHVGAQFFDEHFGDRHRPAESRGLVPSFDEIDDELFDPRQVHPLIRTFYKNSGAFNVVMERVVWRSPFDRIARVYSPLARRVFKQLAVPFSTNVPRRMSSLFGELDVDSDGTADFRTWVRYFPADGRSESAFFYAAAIQVIRVVEAGKRRSFLSVCFPLLHGNKTSVLTFNHFRQNGLLLTTEASTSSISGSYLVFSDVPRPGKVSYLPALGLGETLRFWVDPQDSEGCIRGEHLEFWRETEVFRLEYRIVRGDGEQIRLQRATDAIFSTE